MAPAMPPWPDGLPEATLTPDGATVLPPALADAVWRRLAIADTFPARCQAHLDALGQLQRARQQEAIALAIDKWAREHVPEAAPWWRPYLITGGLAASLVGGLVVGVVAAR